MKQILVVISVLVSSALQCCPVQSLVSARAISVQHGDNPGMVEVEYLESTGTQWIDTQWSGIANRYYYFSIDFQFTKTNADTDILGIRDGNVIYVLTLYGSVFRGFTNSILIGWDSKRHLYEFNKVVEGEYKQCIDNLERPYNGFGTAYFPSALTKYTIPLFGRKWNNNTTRFLSTARIYSFKITDVTDKENPIALVDIIPVRIGKVGFMYDKIRELLFDNQGTGDFIVGPDVR